MTETDETNTGLLNDLIIFLTDITIGRVPSPEVAALLLKRVQQKRRQLAYEEARLKWPLPLTPDQC